MNFVTVDVETANNNVSSICQIGLAKYIDFELVDTYSTLIMPEGDFGFYNTRVHGLTAHDVKDSPCMDEIHDEIMDFISEGVMVSYSNFDKRSLRSCWEAHSLSDPRLRWADALAMLRRHYPQYAKRGGSLGNVCKDWGFAFNHHDALEDAKACGFLMCKMMKEHSIDIDKWAAY